MELKLTEYTNMFIMAKVTFYIFIVRSLKKLFQYVLFKIEKVLV